METKDLATAIPALKQRRALIGVGENLDIHIELRSLDRLIPNEANPRAHSQGQVEQIAASIREFGFVNPILVGPDGSIVAGEGRFRAAMILGMRKVPVIVLGHLSDIQRRALAITDNQLALNASWDERLLREQLAALEADSFDLSILGFDDEELVSRLADQENAGLQDEDEVPALPIRPVSRLGDLWLLSAGKARTHRLLCGDATNSQDTNRLLEAGPKPIVMITDPPYGVDLQPEWRERAGLNSRTRQGGEVANDQQVDWSRAWTLFPGNVAYIWHAGIHAAEVARGLERSEFFIRSQIVWVKQHFAISRGAYHWQHEPAWYVRRTPSPVGRITIQQDYDDYRDVNGVKFPFKYSFLWLDGRFTANISEVKVNAAVEVAKFAKP